MTDYPDWQVSASTQSGNMFSLFSSSLPAGTYLTTIQPAYSWESLSLIVTASAGAAKITVIHYADPLGTQTIGTDTWSVNSATSLTVRLPVRGPYVQVKTTVTSGVNFVSTTWASFQTYAADRVSFPIEGQIIFESANTLGASATKTYTMPRTCAGSANWSYVPFDNSGALAVYVQAVDELGAIIARVSDRGNPTGNDNAILEVPDLIIQVVVQNTSAVTAHSYGFSLIVPPQ